jgi:O-acetyl-ADP-ribose deacetylase (regulator of RNase III)
MMKELVAELWDLHKKGEWICITTNGSINKDNRLVMGGGIAKEAVDRFPHISQLFGIHVMANGNHCGAFIYERLISFPTKGNWHTFSTVELVQQSCRELMKLIETYRLERVYLPRPGCGLGGLDWKYVKPTIEHILDDRVIVVTNEV